MFKIIVPIALILLLSACEKDEEKVTGETLFTVSCELVEIEEGKISQIPIHVKSSDTGFDITVSVLSDGIMYWEEIPEFENYSNHVALGAQSVFDLSKNDTTFYIDLTPLKILPIEHGIPFSVWIKGGNENVEGYNELYGVEYAQSYYVKRY